MATLRFIEFHFDHDIYTVMVDGIHDRLDLRLYAKTEHDENLTKASVEQIVEKCLGYKVERKREIGMTGWKRYKYRSNDQVVYAAVDAYCAFLIGRNSKAWELNR
ncbi:hypothetical protein E2542_SST01218 [Spatholobus suberectus]|nr:hypothetical protein E2542_SST01218 [Spatholobus suberectus]